jgi:leucyl-tRNA synthetase
MVLDEHGEVMSKSKGNVVSPEKMIAGYGADAVRAYVLFMGPVDKEKMWNEDGLAGIYKFLNRLWRIVCDLKCAAGDKTLFDPTADATNAHDKAEKLRRERHRVAEKVTVDFERNNFNTALAAIMELGNAAADLLRVRDAEHRANCQNAKPLCDDVADTIVRLMAPVAPHWAEELWHEVLEGEGSIHDQAWPEFDPEQAKSNVVELAVQVNGKVRGRITVAADAAEDEVRETALAAVSQVTEGKNIFKVIVVPGRLVNIVAK